MILYTHSPVRAFKYESAFCVPVGANFGIEEGFIRFDRTQIVDLSPLSSLTNLTTIDLRYNQISDISLLSSLTNLMWLDLSGNQISDISPLVENHGLGSGDDLWLKGNNLDLQAGSKAMNNIRALEERGARVHLHDEPSR